VGGGELEGVKKKGKMGAAQTVRMQGGWCKRVHVTGEGSEPSGKEPRKVTVSPREASVCEPF